MPVNANPILYRHRLTRLGFHFLFVAVFAIVGGSLRGFNLLLVLAGLLFSVVIVQWRQGRSTIRRIRLRRRPIPGGFAGEPIHVIYDVANLSGWFPVWMIRIADRMVTDGQGTESSKGGFLRHDDLDSGEAKPVELVASVGFARAGSIASTSVLCRFSRRGAYRMGPLEASTLFPFSLMSSDSLHSGSEDLLYVYPRRVTFRRGWQRLLPPRRGGDGDRSSGGAQQDGEFFGLRPWQSGDQPKHIHWRTTARMGEPAVRQFEQRSRHHVCVIVDQVIESDDDASIADFERSLELAGTLLCELAGPSESVALVVPSGSTAPDAAPQILHCSGCRSAEHDLSELMKRLATAQFHTNRSSSNQTAEHRPLARAVSSLASQLERYDLVVVSCRSMEQVCAAPDEPARSVLGFFHRRGRLSWWNVTSPQIRHLFQPPHDDAGPRSPDHARFEGDAALSLTEDANDVLR